MIEEPLLPRFNALLVEGVPGIGKSTLIDALIRRHVERAAARQIRSVLHLCQAHTFGPLAPAEDEGTLTARDNLEHLEHILRMLEWLHSSVEDNRKPSCFVVIDTLHLTHCVRPGILQWMEAADCDRRLARIGCKLLLLQGSADVIWQRSIEARADWPFLREYASKFGRTHEELHNYFLREQEHFARMFEQSELPKLLMPNDGAAEDILDEAFNFWYASRLQEKSVAPAD